MEIRALWSDMKFYVFLQKFFNEKFEKNITFFKFFRIEFKKKKMRVMIPFSNILDIFEYVRIFLLPFQCQNTTYVDSNFIFSFMEDFANH